MERIWAPPSVAAGPHMHDAPRQAHIDQNLPRFIPNDQLTTQDLASVRRVYHNINVPPVRQAQPSRPVHLSQQQVRLKTSRICFNLSN